MNNKLLAFSFVGTDRLMNIKDHHLLETMEQRANTPANN